MGKMFNDEFLDALAVVSFIVGILNYDENLSQSDKDDIMRELDEKTTGLLEKLEKEIEVQNDMLREILHRLEKLEDQNGKIFQ